MSPTNASIEQNQKKQIVFAKEFAKNLHILPHHCRGADLDNTIDEICADVENCYRITTSEINGIWDGKQFSISKETNPGCDSEINIIFHISDELERPFERMRQTKIYKWLFTTAIVYTYKPVSLVDGDEHVDEKLHILVLIISCFPFAENRNFVYRIFHEDSSDKLGSFDGILSKMHDVSIMSHKSTHGSGRD